MAVTPTGVACSALHTCAAFLSKLGVGAAAVVSASDLLVLLQTAAAAMTPEEVALLESARTAAKDKLIEAVIKGVRHIYDKTQLADGSFTELTEPVVRSYTNKYVYCSGCCLRLRPASGAAANWVC